MQTEDTGECYWHLPKNLKSRGHHGTKFLRLIFKLFKVQIEDIVWGGTNCSHLPHSRLRNGNEKRQGWCNEYELQHTSTHTLYTIIRTTHELGEHAERKWTDILSKGWKCLARRRWAWRRFGPLEHMCFSLLDSRPVPWAVTGWTLRHGNVRGFMQMHLWCYLCKYSNTGP